MPSVVNRKKILHGKALLLTMLSFVVLSGLVIFQPVKVNAAYEESRISAVQADVRVYRDSSSNSSNSDSGSNISLDDAQSDLEATSITKPDGKTEKPSEPEDPSFWSFIKGTALTKIFNSILSHLAWPLFSLTALCPRLVDNVYAVTVSSSAGSSNAPGFFIVAFRNTDINQFYHFFDQFTKIWAIVGFVIAAAEEAIRYSTGSGNPVGFVKNAILGFAYAGFFSDVALLLFNAAYSLGSGILNIYSTNINTGAVLGQLGLVSGLSIGVLGMSAGGWVALASTSIKLVGLLLILVGLFFLIVTAKMCALLLKNVAAFLALTAKGSIMGFFVMRGNMSTVSTYLMQLFSFYLQIVVQMGFYGLGFRLMSSGGYWLFSSKTLLGIALILSVNEVPGWVGGVSLEDDVAKIVHEAHDVSCMMRTAVGGFGGFSSPGAATSVGDAADAATEGGESSN